MTRTSRQNSGDNGEEAASQYLINHGFHILVRNYRSRYGEIDIIAQKDGIVVFTEVKYLQNSFVKSPGDQVDARKQRKIIKTALCYIEENDNGDLDYRFDVVEISGNRINHIENAFEMPDTDII